MKNWTLDRPGINVSTIQGIKGLETGVIILPDINKYRPTTQQKRLCYVAMTRAINYLVISATGENKWTVEIEEMLSEREAEKALGQCISCNTSITIDINLKVVRCRSCWSKKKKEPIEGKYCH